MENAKPVSKPTSAASSPSGHRVRRAVIDIGTNSVKLLVAEVSGNRVEPLVERSEQTRLGRGFYETRRLQPDALAHTARVVAEFAAQARELGTVALRVIATSAARDAVNSAELTRCRAAVDGYIERVVHPVVASELRSFASRAVQLVGTGGTTSVMARIELNMTDFDRDRIEALRLSREQVRRQRERLWSLPL